MTRSNKRPTEPTPDSGLHRKANELRMAAARWLMPTDSKGYDGSVEQCRGSKLPTAAPSRPEVPNTPDQTALTRHDEEAEVIWLTRLVAVVASGVLTMFVWLFTPLGW